MSTIDLEDIVYEETDKFFRYSTKKLGYETAILNSSEMGLNMYKQMGFKEY